MADLNLFDKSARVKIRKAEVNASWYRRKRLAQLAAEPPDPIALLSNEEVAYISGLIDGEGCIRIGYVGPKKLTHYLSIAVAMTHEGVVRWLHHKLNTGRIKINNHTEIRRHDGNWATQYVVRLHGVRAQLLCQRMLPYLKVKKAHAEVAIQFPCDCRIGGRNQLTEEVQAVRLRLREQMTRLNLRGKALIALKGIKS